ENSPCLGTGEDGANMGALGVGCGPVIQVIHVSTTGSDSTGDGSEESPFATIQTAIDSSSDGDTVLVAAGTYMENLIMGGSTSTPKRSVTLLSFSGPDNTIIDGNYQNSTIEIYNHNYNEDADSIAIIGFTIKGGNSNLTDYDGVYGGGIAINGGDVYYFEDLLFVDNDTDINLQWTSGAIAYIDGCTFISDDDAAWIGVITAYLDASSILITNSIFYDYQVGDNSIFVDAHGITSITYSLIYPEVYEGVGNINANPLFCNPDSGDYTLAANSPCLGTGENGANMGAFGLGCVTPISFDWDFSLSEPVIEVMGADDEWNPGDTISISMDFCNNTDVGHFAYPGAVLEADSNLTSLPFTGSHHWFYGISADTCYSVAWHVAADTSIVSDTIATFSAYPKTLNCDDENQGGYCIDGDTVTFEIPIVVQVVSTESEHFVPEEFTLHQNYPNPFNPVTTIQYDIPEAGHVRLDIYNILGEKVSTLASGNHEVGRYAVNWDASGMASGMYFYRVNAGNFTDTKKLVLLK
ncbi:MAG: T9SS type A sorting domain-containing protein, partial [Candidatus Marinimicrobia bacterium]|nr:T9SS type A sorting domain-containing protein [Candidatus Neomarinimicrobiota bacterium]